MERLRAKNIAEISNRHAKIFDADCFHLEINLNKGKPISKPQLLIEPRAVFSVRPAWKRSIKRIMAKESLSG